MPSLNLVVLRSPDLRRAVEFYSLLGLGFTEHQHGKGPMHLAAELEGGGVFELYPLEKNAESTIGTRIGFRVAGLDALVAGIAARGGRFCRSRRSRLGDAVLWWRIRMGTRLSC